MIESYSTATNRLKASLDGSRLAELSASEDSLVTKLLLDAEDLVELGETLRTGGSTSLDLARAKTDGQVSNEGVLSLTGTVGNHNTPASTVSKVGSVNRLSDRANLVDLEEKSVGSLDINGLSDETLVSDSQIITDNLDVGSLSVVKVLPGIPVVLSEGVLKRDDGVLLDELTVVSSELLVRESLRLVGVRVLEVKVVLAVLVELGGSSINGNADLARVTGSVNGSDNKVKSLLSGVDIRGDTTLVTNVTGTRTVLLLGKLLENVVDLGTSTESISEGGEVDGSNHELLDGKVATSVLTTVKDVLERNGENVGSLGARDGAEVLVQRNLLLSGTSTGSSKRDTKDGVSTKLALVLGTVKLEEEVIESTLVSNVEVGLQNGRSNDVVDVGDSLQDTLATPDLGVTVTELKSLVRTSRGARGDSSAEGAELSGEVNLNSGVATGVVDVAGEDLRNSHSR